MHRSFDNIPTVCSRMSVVERDRPSRIWDVRPDDFSCFTLVLPLLFFVYKVWKIIAKNELDHK